MTTPSPTISPELRAEFEERFPRPQKEPTHFSDVEGKKDCKCLECNFDYDAILSFVADREAKARQSARNTELGRARKTIQRFIQKKRRIPARDRINVLETADEIFDLMPSPHPKLSEGKMEGV